MYSAVQKYTNHTNRVGFDSISTSDDPIDLKLSGIVKNARKISFNNIRANFIENIKKILKKFKK